MKKLVRMRPRLHLSSFDRQIEALLATIQQEQPPGHEHDYVVINLESYDYVLGKTPEGAMAAYEKRWPHGGFFACRADGGAFSKMHWRKP